MKPCKDFTVHKISEALSFKFDFKKFNFHLFVGSENLAYSALFLLVIILLPQQSKTFLLGTVTGQFQETFRKVSIERAKETAVILRNFEITYFLCVSSYFRRSLFFFCALLFFSLLLFNRDISFLLPVSFELCRTLV